MAPQAKPGSQVAPEISPSCQLASRKGGTWVKTTTCSLWRAAGAVAADELNGRAANAVMAFINLVERMAHRDEPKSAFHRGDVVHPGEIGVGVVPG